MSFPVPISPSTPSAKRLRSLWRAQSNTLLPLVTGLFRCCPLYQWPAALRCRISTRQGALQVMRSVLAGALAVAVAAVSFTAQAAVSPEDQIKLRKAGYSYMSWNMGKIKAQVIDQSVAYDQQQILAAANTLNAIANSCMGALYGPGTDRHVGSQTTRVKPEMFDNFDDVAKLSGDLSRATGELVAAAEADDQGAIRTAFAAVGQSCKGCHDKYRMD